MNKFNPENNSYTAGLREYLAVFFKSRGVESYYQKASSDTKFPYITYELRLIQGLDDSGTGRRYIMEINAYNRGKESILENLLDFLEQELDGFQEMKRDMFFCSDLAYSRFDVEEDEPLKRKSISFEINYWIKERNI